jgi:hypothetical protein
MPGCYASVAPGGTHGGPGCYARATPIPNHSAVQMESNPFEQAEKAHQDEADRARGTSSEKAASAHGPRVNEPRNKALISVDTVLGQNIPGCQPKVGMPRPEPAQMSGSNPGKRAPPPDEGTAVDKGGHKRPCPPGAR